MIETIYRHTLFLVLFVPLIVSCQSSGVSQQNNVIASNLLVGADSFKNSDDTPIHSIETPTEIFRLPKEEKDKLNLIVADYESSLDSGKSLKESIQPLYDFILSYADTGLLYENTATRTVSETLNYGKANCLSLSILAYSLAEESGLEATFQDVDIPEFWTNELNQTWLNGHVNVRLKKYYQDYNNNAILKTIRYIVVDFDPYSRKKRFKTTDITKQRILAMFYNNKAAIAIAEKNYKQAYLYYTAAIEADSKLAITWSNLGVLYRTHNLFQLAEQAYHYSLSLDPFSTNTMSNLAYLYQHIGKTSQAAELERIVQMKRKNNPYYFLMLGAEAFQQEKFKESIKYYKTALILDNDNHDAYFGLAKNYVLLNELTLAKRFINKAKTHTTSIENKMNYQRKLSILNQLAKAH
ncbi:tetratricopeptide repeat protein [Rheinheimera sp. WS51]|uniref:tetratricopeptide repeat protein n=1 Tax=Rheinheimera sp. WS51 TaxID=3425886 RepID=UPI003D8E0B72